VKVETQKAIGIVAVVLGATGGVCISLYALARIIFSGTILMTPTSQSETGSYVDTSFFEAMLRNAALGGTAAVTVGIVMIVRARAAQRRRREVALPAARALA
jgi:hypothetical protein